MPTLLDKSASVTNPVERKILTGIDSTFIQEQPGQYKAALWVSRKKSRNKRTVTQ